MAMPRPAAREEDTHNWDPRLFNRLERAEKAMWLAIFVAGVDLSDKTQPDACAPTLLVMVLVVMLVYCFPLSRDRFEGCSRVRSYAIFFFAP